MHNQDGDDYDLSALGVTIDLNNNGLADSGEPVLEAGGTVSLEPGESVHFVITGTVPANAQVDQEARVLISATTTGQQVRMTNIDTIIVTDLAALSITKSASQLTPQPGDVVTFTLDTANDSTADAAGIPVEVDGVPISLVVVRDVIPANTTLDRVQPITNATPLYHQLGAPEHRYTSTPPADLSQVDAVGVAQPRLQVGERLTLVFSVVIHNNATGTISNIGEVAFDNGADRVREPSNTVELNVPTVLPTIHYYRDATYTGIVTSISLGEMVFVQGDAAACNTDPTQVERHVIIITADRTGDIEVFEAIESDPNTGLFRIEPPPLTLDAAFNPVQSGNGAIETQANDTLTARLEGCGTAFVETVLLIDPFGVVFDSKTNEPVPGAVVRLIDVTGQGNGGQPGEAALVFEEVGIAPVLGPNANAGQAADGTTRQTLVDAPSTLSTDEAGAFTFPLVRPSTYRLEITPPAGYRFPSTIPPALLPPGRFIDASGSYNGTFEVDSLSPVRIDIPVDRDDAGGLFVEKKASAQVVELGEFLDYTLRIQNNREVAVDNVTLSDTLPAGFGLERGSVRLDGVRQNDPQGSPGPALVFALGAIPAREIVTLTYRVRVRPGALQGDGINRAQAQSDIPFPVISNIAAVQVDVRDDVFSDQGFIIGKVYVDCNHNDIQDAGEQGIPGVRLYLENGTFAITDSAGKYNFFGVTPQTHVLKVDADSMPAGSKLVSLSNRHAGSASSRFVDLKKRELHKADFAEGSCSPQVMTEVEARREQSAQLLPETEKGIKTELLFDADRGRVINPRKQPASGLIEGEERVPRFTTSQPPEPAATTSPVLPSESRLVAPENDLHGILSQLDITLDFLDLRDGDILPIAQTRVRVKGRAQTTLALVVNGTELPDTRVGQKTADPQSGVQVWEYIGVTLEPGQNTLTLIQRDPFGNPRGEKTITLTAPDQLGAIQIVGPGTDAVADGHTPAPITVQLEDMEGLPVTVRTPVTLVSDRGRWEVTDLDPLLPGVQVFIEGGSGTFPLLPPYEPGDVVVKASSGVLHEEAVIAFLPELRPLLAVGVIEGTINVSKLNAKALTPVREQDSFERELRELSFTEGDGKVRGGGRAAFFLKGKIKGEYLLTMAYDSDKDTEERLFRDIQPDRFYPVYGDASVRGFDAQSTGRFYVRVDKNRSYLLYGDFTTETLTPARQLGQFSRSQTGAKLHYENDRVSVNVFGSLDDHRQVVEEIPGRGISGPYTLSNRDIVENSEKVELLTRDRDQPELILNIEPQVRFEDYEFDALSGSLLFREPVPSIDLNLNPIVIRVTYEIEQGGEDFWVAGIDGQVVVTEHLEVGGSYARDDNPEDRLDMYSGNAILKLAEDTRLIGEISATNRDHNGFGIGWRADLRHKGLKLDASAHVARTGKDFDNPSAGIARERFEVRAQALYRLTDRTHVSGEVIHTEDMANGGQRDGGELTLTQNFGNNIFAELGVRHTRETTAPAQRETADATPFESTSVRSKLGAQMPFLPQLSLFGEYEQDVQHLDRRVAAVGGEYQFLRRGRVYARHELISSLSGPFSLNSNQTRHTTLAGVDYDYTQGGQVFSEYRIRDGVAARDAHAAIGLRHRFRLAEGLLLHAGIERIQTVEGPDDRDGTSLTGSISYTAHPLWKGTARLELRESPGNNSLLNTIGVAYN